MNWKFFIKAKILVTILAIVLPLLALYLDFQVYKNHVSSLGEKKEDFDGGFLLNTPLLQKISAELENKKEFLLSPTYPLLKEPF